jgi:hypothetical protein
MSLETTTADVIERHDSRLADGFYFLIFFNIFPRVHLLHTKERRKIKVKLKLKKNIF